MQLDIWLPGGPMNPLLTIYYVPGILFAPITMLLAIVTWLFEGKA
jgi:hypothetical protein